MKRISTYWLKGKQVSLVALLLVLAITSFATDRYVSASAGNDANSGLLGFPKQTIQAAINSANNGDKIFVSSGTYDENINVNKEVVIQGAGQAATTIVPAISNPTCGGTGTSSLCAGASNVILIQASNVTIDQLTVDGDNPALTSTVIVDGVDIDARNGIITGVSGGPVFNNLTVHHVTVKNIYWRGINITSGGTFTISDNTVINVQGDPGFNSIALFNYGGAGSFTNNHITGSTAAIASNFSKGTIYSGNTIERSDNGIHTDNNELGTADIIQNNIVKDGKDWAWGIWVFAPSKQVVVKDNIISNVYLGLAAAAQRIPEMTLFTGNVVDGNHIPGSIGVYLTTTTWWWGSTDLATNFSNNTLTNNDYGFYIESEAGQKVSLLANNNSITSYVKNATQGTGAYGAGTFNLDMNCNWWGSAVGATIDASIDGSSVLHSSWLANGIDLDAVATGFQPANAICASPLSGVLVSTVVNANCYGSANGSASIAYATGLPAILYSLNGGAAVPVSGSPFAIQNLAAGTYTVVVTDAGGYTATVNFSITQPAAIIPTITAAGADAFCNSLALTTPAIPGNTYNWSLVSGSYTAATNEISLGQANADGVYQVKVTSNGCTSLPGSFTFNKQSVISSYTLLAFSKIELGENNTVASGSVGVVSVNGKASFHKNSSVASNGAFVKAKTIKKEGTGINISNPIYESATGITLPALLVNTSNTKYLPNKEVAKNSNTTVTGNYKNLKLKKGSNTVVTGNIFGSILLEQGASVRFTASTINIDQLQVVQGTKNGYSIVRFAPNTHVLISGSVSIGSQVYVNPDNYKVSFYLADQTSDEEKFTVNGGNTKLTANIYIAKGKLKVIGGNGNEGEGRNDHENEHTTGNSNYAVEMTGLFIAEKIESNDKNVIWNSFTCGSLPVSVHNTIFVNQSVTDEKITTGTDEDLQVIVLPNPSTSYFTLKIESRYQTPIALRVIDNQGRVIDAKSKISANSTIQMGQTYSSGTYFAELMQGTRRLVVQLIKLKS